jgi:hypothetical protein
LFPPFFPNPRSGFASSTGGRRVGLGGAAAAVFDGDPPPPPAPLTADPPSCRRQQPCGRGSRLPPPHWRHRGLPGVPPCNSAPPKPSPPASSIASQGFLNNTLVGPLSASLTAPPWAPSIALPKAAASSLHCDRAGGYLPRRWLWLSSPSRWLRPLLRTGNRGSRPPSSRWSLSLPHVGGHDSFLPACTVHRIGPPIVSRCWAWCCCY